MLLLRSPFLVARLCSVSLTFKFLPVSILRFSLYSLFSSLYSVSIPSLFLDLFLSFWTHITGPLKTSVLHTLLRTNKNWGSGRATPVDSLQTVAQMFWKRICCGSPRHCLLEILQERERFLCLPSVSLARPPVGWQSTMEQDTHSTTVWAWLKTVVIL